MSPPDARRSPAERGTAQDVGTAKRRQAHGTRHFALTEAQLRAQAIERVVCHDLTHGVPIDDDTALWVASMAGSIDRLLDVAKWPVAA